MSKSKGFVDLTLSQKLTIAGAVLIVIADTLSLLGLLISLEED